MNINNFVKELFEDVLGLDVLGLENRYKDLVELINRKSLPTFSNYIKCSYFHYIDLNDRDLIIREEYGRVGREYYIKDNTLDQFNLPVLDIVKVTFIGNGTDPEDGYYMNSMIACRESINIESVLIGAEMTTFDTLTANALPYKKYHELRGDRILFLKNYPLDGKVEIEMRTKFPNITAIPDSYKEIFMAICKYDIKIKLWNELKYIEDVVTPNGNLNLKISDWDSADRDRDEYLKELRTKTLPDRIGTGYFQII